MDSPDSLALMARNLKKTKKKKHVQLAVEKKNLSDSPLLKDDKRGGETPQPDQIVLSEQTVWEKLAFLKLSIEEKAFIAENIVLDIQSTVLYWVLLVVSIIIASFGLLQNSVAVIIGGMLIAPLFNPIKGLAFGITTGQSNYFWKATIMLIGSVSVAIAVAFVVTLLIPLRVETAEILARTSPNLLDLFIAIASGSIAILSLYFKKLSQNLAGVAMAASLMPPLAVVGIELALGNYSHAVGGAFLFATNLFAILAIGIIIFLTYGFFPRHEENKSRSLQVGAMLVTLLIFISFPLVSSLTEISDQIQIQSQASVLFGEMLGQRFQGANLSELTITSFDDDSVVFEGSIRVPEDSAFHQTDHRELSTVLSQRLGRRVRLELEIVPLLVLGE